MLGMAQAAMAVPKAKDKSKVDVALTVPVSGSSYTAPAAIVIAATASSSQGNHPIVKVEFFNGTALLGTATTAPYTFNWTNVAAGNYQLMARATDDKGDDDETAPITINVNAPPTISITAPANNTSVTGPANIQLTANAADTDGSIAKVEYFNGNALIGTATTAPYSITWSNVAPGNYQVTAKATDNQGATATSVAIAINVNAVPSVIIGSPATSYLAPAAITLNATAGDTDGTIAKVDFFNGATLIGTANTAPYTFSWTNVAAGNYSVTAVATDNQGAIGTSTVMAINVNAPPTVTLIAPTNNASYTGPATITLTANANDADGTIAKVEFFNGSTLLGNATSAPFAFTWNSVAPGNYQLTAKATDNQGATAMSAAIAINVNAPPSVTLSSPTTSYLAPAAITLNATASDTDGTITKVEFFNGVTLIGTATTAPYSFNWANVAGGNYSVTAVATDNQGTTATSTALTINVNAAPTVAITAPTNNASYTGPANITLMANANDADGSVAKVEFFNGSTLLGTATAAPYSISWTNVAPGNYSITAVVTDNQGAIATSAAIVINVNAAPAITLNAAGSGYIAPATVSLAATATDTDGTIAKVEFYNGATLLGSVTTAPYTFAWTNVAAGSYSVTAIATDSQGAATTSNAVSITVAANSAPTVAIITPSNNQTFIAPAAIAINATASDTDGTVAKVELYEGANLLATITQAPYSFTWNAAPGSYTLFAKATDNLGAVTTSTAVNITVTAVNVAPTVTLSASPTNAAAPATINLAATAADSDGAIAKVEFFNGAALLATSTSAPYTYSWTNVAAGSYQVTAKATDNQGASTTSAAVVVTVTSGQAQVYFIDSDHLNTPRVITNVGNQIVWQWDNNDPFGANVPNQDPSNTGTPFVFNLRFPGQYADKETGLHYNGFRDYDPATGTYPKSDPIGLRGGINTYAYARSNPLKYKDPSGLVVQFLGPPATQSALRGAYGIVKATRRGRELCEILEQSTTTFIIRGDNSEAYFDPSTNTINVDPSFHPDTATPNCMVPATTDSILGHELGHAATGTADDGPGNMNNVNQNENPIRRELLYPPRTAY